MPAILFFALYNLVPEDHGLNVTAAVLAATAWSIKAAVGRRRKGLNIGWWLPGLTIYLLLRASVTVAVERGIVDFGISSEAVYFGIGFATKFLVGVVLGITVLTGRPFLAWALPRALRLPDDLVSDPRYVRTMANATWLIVGYEIVSAGWDVWLFNNSAFNLFYVTRTGLNFVTSTICIAAGMFYIDRSLSAVDSYPGIVGLLEASGHADPSQERESREDSGLPAGGSTASGEAGQAARGPAAGNA